MKCITLIHNLFLKTFRLSFTVETDVDLILGFIIKMEVCVLVISFFYIYIYFRIVVMDEGVVVEFDEPKCLLNDETSLFHGMVNSSKTLH